MTQKAFRIEPVPQSAMVRIVWEGGGEVPAELSGSYTSPLAAKQHISAWSAANREVEVKVKREEDEKKEQGKVGKGPKPEKEIEPI